jgi:hypothetical protein
MNARVRRLVFGLLAVLAALELAYVAAGVYLVRSGQVERWINKHPEKLRITFGSAWTVVPGVVHFRGLRFVQQGRGSQLEGVVDSGGGTVEPAELLARRVHVVGLRASGVEFRWRPRPKTAEEVAGPHGALPAQGDEGARAPAAHPRAGRVRRAAALGFLDGETSFVVAGPWALFSYSDFVFLMAATTWVENESGSVFRARATTASRASSARPR